MLKPFGSDPIILFDMVASYTDSGANRVSFVLRAACYESVYMAKYGLALKSNEAAIKSGHDLSCSTRISR